MKKLKKKHQIILRDFLNEGVKIKLDHIKLTDKQALFLATLNHKQTIAPDGAVKLHNNYLKAIDRNYGEEIIEPLEKILGLIGKTIYSPGFDFNTGVTIKNLKSFPRSYWLTRKFYLCKKRYSFYGKVKERVHDAISSYPDDNKISVVEKSKVPIHPLKAFHLQAIFKNITFDEEIFKLLEDKAEIKPRNLYHYQDAVRDMFEGRHWFSEIDTGRLYSSYASLPSIYRACTLIDGQKLYEIDVRACQLSLIPALYIKPCKEKQKLISVIESGKDPYLQIWGEHFNNDRNKIKSGVSAWLNGAEEQIEEIQNVFIGKFPIIGNFIKERIEADKEYEFCIGHNLQTIEARILIQNVYWDLIFNDNHKMEKINGNVPLVSDGIVPLLPVHDAFMTTKANLKAVHSKMVEAFKNELGYVPRFKLQGKQVKK